MPDHTKPAEELAAGLPLLPGEGCDWEWCKSTLAQALRRAALEGEARGLRSAQDVLLNSGWVEAIGDMADHLEQEAKSDD